MVPSAKTLIEMKLKSIPNRTDSFKRTKDVADLYDLLQTHRELIERKEISRPLVKKFKNKLEEYKTNGTISGAVAMLNTEEYRVNELLEKL